MWINVVIICTMFHPGYLFNIEIERTRCNVGASDICESLYDAMCENDFCKCPINTNEDPHLKRCVPSSLKSAAKTSAQGSLFDDLPFDFSPSTLASGTTEGTGFPITFQPGKVKIEVETEEGKKNIFSGIRTRCSEDLNIGGTADICDTLYDAVCKGGYCLCPVGKQEDSNTNRCVPGPKHAVQSTNVGSGGLFDDLPFDFEPSTRKDNKEKMDNSNNEDATTVENEDLISGILQTRCNSDPNKGEITNPCSALYDAICRNGYCVCPLGSKVDFGLRRCTRSTTSMSTSGSSGGLFDDLPFDFEPGRDKRGARQSRDVEDDIYDEIVPPVAEKLSGKSVFTGIGVLVVVVVIGLFVYIFCCKRNRNMNVGQTPLDRMTSVLGSVPVLRNLTNASVINSVTGSHQQQTTPQQPTYTYPPSQPSQQQFPPQYPVTGWNTAPPPPNSQAPPSQYTGFLDANNPGYRRP